MTIFFLFKQKTAYEMRISDWSSDVCSSDLGDARSHPCTMGAAVRRQRAGVGSAEAERPLGDFEAGFDLRRIFGDRDADDVERRSARDEARDDRGAARSEERRVGKEGVRTCRSRWSTHHKNTSRKYKP